MTTTNPHTTIVYLAGKLATTSNDLQIMSDRVLKMAEEMDYLNKMIIQKDEIIKQLKGKDSGTPTNT